MAAFAAIAVAAAASVSALGGRACIGAFSHRVGGFQIGLHWRVCHRDGSDRFLGRTAGFRSIFTATPATAFAAFASFTTWALAVGGFAKGRCGCHLGFGLGCGDRRFLRRLTTCLALGARTLATPVGSFAAFRAVCALASFWAFCLFATRRALAFASLTASGFPGTFAATTAATLTVLGLATCRLAWRRDRCFGAGNGFGGLWGHAKQALQPGKESGVCRCGGLWGRGCCRCGRNRRRRFGLGRCDGGRAVRQDAFDDRFLAIGALLAAARHRGHVVLLVGELVADVEVVQSWVVVLQTLQLVVRCIQRFVRHQQHVDALTQFDFGDFGPLFVEQETGHFDRHLHEHGRSAVFQGLFLDHAQDLQGGGFGVANMAGAAAARAGNRGAFIQSGTQPLAAHFQQAELADRAKLHAGAVLAQRIAQAVFDFAAVLALLHVDEVDHDQAAEVAQAGLAGHFVGGFQVGAGGRFLDVTAFDGTRRVHVHRHQRFGLVDHDRAAAGQLHRAAVGGLDLVFNLKAAEQWCVVAVAFDAVALFRHHVRHELVRLFVDVIRVDQDFTNVAVEVIANGANHQAGFLINQESTLAGFGGAVNRVPQFQQVIEVPLQFAGIPTNASGARNDAHAVGVFELIQSGLQFGPVFAFNAATHPAATRIVGHQHHVSTGQTDKGGQCSTFVAAFFLFDLDQQFLAFANHVLNTGL